MSTVEISDESKMVDIRCILNTEIELARAFYLSVNSTAQEILKFGSLS